MDVTNKGITRLEADKVMKTLEELKQLKPIDRVAIQYFIKGVAYGNTMKEG